MIDPCLTTSIVGTEYPSVATYVGGSGSTFTNLWYDALSGTSSLLLCGALSTTKTKTIAPTLYVEETMGNIFTWS